VLRIQQHAEFGEKPISSLIKIWLYHI